MTTAEADIRRHAIPVRVSDNELETLAEAVRITGIPRSALMRNGALAEARRAALAEAASGDAGRLIIEYDPRTGGVKVIPAGQIPTAAGGRE